METGDDTAHFQAQLKAYLFHIWCVDEQKEQPPSRGAVVAFFVILAPNTKLPTYLLTYIQALSLSNRARLWVLSTAPLRFPVGSRRRRLNHSFVVLFVLATLLVFVPEKTSLRYDSIEWNMKPYYKSLNYRAMSLSVRLSLKTQNISLLVCLSLDIVRLFLLRGPGGFYIGHAKKFRHNIIRYNTIPLPLTCT